MPLQISQSDAGAAMVIAVFGVVAVFYMATYCATLQVYHNAYARLSGGADAVFKGILYQRNKHHWRYGERVGIAFVDVSFQSVVAA